MAYWWVNQGQTWRFEVWGGFMWSPQLNRNGSKSHYYDNMTRVEVGDLVFSYFRGAISALGRVTSAAVPSLRPELGNAGSNWNPEGWAIEVHFETLSSPVNPRSLLPLYNQIEWNHGPMNHAGAVTQFYLFALPDAFGSALLSLCAPNGVDELLSPGLDSQFSSLLRDVIEVEAEEEVTATVRKQLGLARVGQGLFKRRVGQYESRCRITGVSSRNHLIASHMKPWKLSTDKERLDGANGLLLSPHVDHLFDRGFLTFEDSGECVLSSRTPDQVVEKWHLRNQKDLQPFNKKQLEYLAFHQAHVFEGWAS